MDEFGGKTRFPLVTGAIDGCPIPIICPKDDPEDYHNRKGFHSFILQGFEDSRSVMLTEYQRFLARTCP